MASSPQDDIEELTLCPRCRRPFDDAERPPKLLACKHHFCLACARQALGRGREVYCALCWKRTELPDGRAERLPTHRPVLALARRLAAPAPARPLLLTLQRLAARRRDLQLRALDAATALKLRLEAELAQPPPLQPVAPDAAARGRHRLRAQLADAQLQAQLDDLVRGAARPLDLEYVRRALAVPVPPESPSPEPRDPVLFLANYCIATLFARQWARPEQDEVESPSPPTPGGASLASASASPVPRAPHPFPLFYFDLEVDGQGAGRVVVEVRSDVAPRMARNFAALATGELGVGYRGCCVFQCWENESVITGDFELNNGRGGRSAFEESYFMPDDTRLAAVRGAVGMRRSQKRHDNLGLVGSQFRIVLREMRGFTAIFAAVVEGLELVDRVSRAGDGAGKPHSSIVISACGRID